MVHDAAVTSLANQQLGSFSSDDGDGNENVILKYNFLFLYRFRDY